VPNRTPTTLARTARSATALALGVASLLGGRPAHAQDWRTLDASRQLADSALVRVKVTYGAGKLTLGAAAALALYDMKLRFDAEHADPLSNWDATTRTLRVGTHQSGARMPGSLRAGSLELGLTRRVPMDLSIDLGAVEASLDLSALRLRTLEFHSGASETTIRFDSVAAEPLERFDLGMGAASVKVYGLGNARVGRVDAQGGVGDLLLDFSGPWTRDVQCDLSLAIGKAVVRVPADVGVRVETRNRWLNAVDLEGLVQKDGAWESPNFEGAVHKLRVDLNSVFGKFALERR
jgi:hypothetical protein